MEEGLTRTHLFKVLFRYLYIVQYFSLDLKRSYYLNDFTNNYKVWRGGLPTHLAIT